MALSLSVVTPSNGRPQALELCRHYVARSSIKPFEHVVVDEPRGMVENLTKALGQVRGDAVAIFEDDDWYHPDWLQHVARTLEVCSLVGERTAFYYHVPTGGFWSEDLTQNKRASLCATAFRVELVPLLLEVLESSRRPFVDIPFWSQARQRGFLWDLVSPPDQAVVGIKGGPGTPGIGAGHRAAFYQVRDPSPARPVLRDLVGDADANRYLAL